MPPRSLPAHNGRCCGLCGGGQDAAVPRSVSQIPRVNGSARPRDSCSVEQEGRLLRADTGGPRPVGRRQRSPHRRHRTVHLVAQVHRPVSGTPRRARTAGQAERGQRGGRASRSGPHVYRRVGRHGEPRDQVAALLVLLYGARTDRIHRLTTVDTSTAGGRTYLALSTEPIEIPNSVAQLFAQLVKKLSRIRGRLGEPVRDRIYSHLPDDTTSRSIPRPSDGG
jgi:hypothetical protein